MTQIRRIKADKKQVAVSYFQSSLELTSFWEKLVTFASVVKVPQVGSRESSYSDRQGNKVRIK